MASVSLNRTKNGFKGSCNHAESDPGSATVHIDAGVKTKPHTHTAEIAISEKLVSATVNGKSKDLVADRGSEARSDTPLVVDFKDDLSITRRRVDTSLPRLANVVKSVGTIVSCALAAPVVGSLDGSSLIISPGDRVLAAVTRSGFRVLKADCVNADVDVGPEGKALIADSGVPLLELIEGDTELG
ncbi:hypothetical protein HG530_010919 [Fusarium avenaceum]|nr:hypothetical protein HG530_010919 [Fusarium avenaceum]